MVWIRISNFKLFNIITRTDKSFISFKHSVLGKLIIMEHIKLKKILTSPYLTKVRSENCVTIEFVDK